MNDSSPRASDPVDAAPLPSRRKFLAATSAVAAGASLASQAVAATVTAPGATEGFGDREIKVGVVGCGGRGTGAVAQLFNTPGPIKLVAMADAFDYRLDGSLKRLTNEATKEAEKKGVATSDLIDVPEDRRFLGIDAYQRLLETDCDLVVLATPPGFRPAQFEAAVDAGKHVFMEKPVATDAPGVRRVLEVGKRAAEQGLAVQVGLQRRHEEHYRDTIARLHDGAIGDILLVRAYWNGDGVWLRPRKSSQSEMEYQVDNWFYFAWACGDHLVEQHIHNIDVANWIKQASPVDAQGQGGRQVRTGKEYGQIFDHHAIEYTYPDGTKLLSQCRHQPGCWRQVGEFAHGTRGTADIGRGVIRGPDGKVVWRYKRKPGRRGGHQQEQTDLIAALRAGQIPNETEYGALSTMTAIMGRMATYSGKFIRWDQAIASERVLVPDGLTWESDPPVLPDADGRYEVPAPGKTEVL